MNHRCVIKPSMIQKKWLVTRSVRHLMFIADELLIRQLGTNISGICINIRQFYIQGDKVQTAVCKWQTFCPGHNVLPLSPHVINIRGRISLKCTIIDIPYRIYLSQHCAVLPTNDITCTSETSYFIMLWAIWMLMGHSSTMSNVWW